MPLFPTAVGMFDLGREFSKNELSFINKLEKRPNMGNLTSLDNYIFKNKKLSKLQDFCLESAGKYVESVICPKHEISLYITQSWANYTDKNHYHHKHAHPNSVVSGVLFIQTEDKKDSIVFYREERYRQIDIPTENFNEFNSQSWWVPAVTGKLMIFPSSLTHSVEKTVSDKTRISISFNTFIKGTVGDNMSLTELKLS